MAENDYTCPTLCDDDCDALCHEGHQVLAKRRHDQADCEARQGGYALGEQTRLFQNLGITTRPGEEVSDG